MPVSVTAGAVDGRPDGSSAPVVRLRLDLAYDGSAFAGWAVQPGLRTVQGILEELPLKPAAIEFVQAPLCREELLVEIEGTAAC